MPPGMPVAKEIAEHFLGVLRNPGPLNGQSRLPPAPRYGVVRSPASVGERLHPLVAVPAQILVEPLHEVVGADLRPVPPVEELGLERAEEPLGPGVVAAVRLARHRAHHAALRADPLPAERAVALNLPRFR